eukprot:12452670-Alexandrium_andersonii.AAC.1
MDKEVARERLEKAKAHVEFAVKLHMSQLERGAHFLREQPPATAVSWDMPEMQKLPSLPQVSAAVGHVCRFGMRISEPASTGVRGSLVRRPTRRAGPAPEVLKRAGRWCRNEGLSPQDPRWRERDRSGGKRKTALAA